MEVFIKVSTLLFFSILVSFQLNAQDNSCADDISPGTVIKKIDEKDYISCLLFQTQKKQTSKAKKEAIKTLKSDFRRFCKNDNDCQNFGYKAKRLKDECFEESGSIICQVTYKFKQSKVLYNKKVDINKKTFQNKKFYRDKSALALGITPNSGFSFDFSLRKTQLNHFGWQVGVKFFQEAVNIGNVKSLATSEVNSDNPDYTDNSAFTFGGGYMGHLGINYNLTAGSFVIVPQFTAGFARINVADDPWFGKDRYSTALKEEIEANLTESFTYFVSGSVIAYSNKETGDDWFLKMEFGQFGQQYMPIYISFGGGIQFTL